MRLIRYRPAAPLDSLVECFWWSQRDAPETSCEHMLPSGTAQLVFALHDDPIVCVSGSAPAAPVAWSRGVVHGPQWSYFVSGPKPCGAMVGVSFRAGAAGALLGAPITELTDRHLAIDTLWGARAGALRERLIAASDPTLLFRALEQHLIAGIRQPLLMHPAVAHALAARSPTRVADIERQAGYSPKHFVALFRSAVGLTPKHYYRVKRFTAVLQRLARADEVSLAELAASAGYADQSHLSREFRAFAGVTPTEYRPRGAEEALHHRVRERLQ